MRFPSLFEYRNSAMTGQAVFFLFPAMQLLIACRRFNPCGLSLGYSEFEAAIQAIRQIVKRNETVGFMRDALPDNQPAKSFRSG